MARRFTRVARSSQKRGTIWIAGVPVIDTEVATGGAILFSLNAAALSLRPFTVVRTHLEYFLFSDQEATTELQVAGVGVAVVSDEAVAVGITAVPTPITDMGSDLWLLHKVIMHNLTRTASGLSSTGHQVSIDSRAMRKVEDGQDLITVHELSTVGSGLTAVVTCRTLVKLH